MIRSCPRSRLSDACAEQSMESDDQTAAAKAIVNLTPASNGIFEDNNLAIQAQQNRTSGLQPDAKCKTIITIDHSHQDSKDDSRSSDQSSHGTIHTAETPSSSLMYSSLRTSIAGAPDFAGSHREEKVQRMNQDETQPMVAMKNCSTEQQNHTYKLVTKFHESPDRNEQQYRAIEIIAGHVEQSASEIHQNDLVERVLGDIERQATAAAAASLRHGMRIEIQANSHGAVTEDDSSSITASSSDERLTDETHEYSRQSVNAYELFNGAFIVSISGSINFPMAKFDVLDMPYQLYRFKITNDDFIQLIEILLKSWKIHLYLFFYNKFFQIAFLLTLCIMLWLLSALFYSKAGGNLNTGLGLFFIISWLCFIFGCILWRLVRMKMDKSCQKKIAEANRLLLRRRVLLTVMESHMFNCNRPMIKFIYFDGKACIEHLLLELESPELIENERIKSKFRRLREFLLTRSPSEAELPDNVDLRNPAILTDFQKRTLAKHLFLHYSGVYVKWLIQHRLPRPMEKRHTKTNIPCICQIVEHFYFKQKRTLSDRF